MPGSPATPPPFSYEEHPDHPGWMSWEFRDDTRFNAFLGEIIVRVEDGQARVRMVPGHRHSNFGDNVHGGALLGFIDVALFAAMRSFGLMTAGPAVTLDLNTHFIGAGKVGEPLEARIELLRETQRLLFLRGLLVQDAGVVCEFSGTIRKPSAPRS
ncbi:PaaI family thioesterase [Sphingomonas sp. 36D10-4-7]|uniref:PaaI family thioesterase n=2 Tax=Sphingomonas corticis TaxID=2722791 RepID=A0ABX1CKZ0_9SPHN|nr:PaaI family thioesterase [Sphingomonas corticis]